MSKVSLHFVFPIEHPPDHLSCHPTLFVPEGCSVPSIVASRSLNTFRNQEELIYPVNVARNVARTRALTKFVIVSDIELIPSRHLVSHFVKMLSRFHLKSDGKVPLKHLVYVVPVFEVEHFISNIPEKKSELLYLYSQNRAIYFHRWICLHCQRFPGLQRWIHHSSTSTDNSIQPMLVVKREFPYHRWEPIYIGTNEEPLYSELLSWEGKQDKMIQMHEMCLLGYRFVILDGAFLVHAPGIKRHPGPRSEVQTAHHYNNMRHYEQIMKAVSDRLGSKQGCKIH
ncbi:beta-1,4-glucuronyltransferase 1-like isoform X2 [Macrosteles quadrilineatus]|uniref:beta-1,4-glucuronyltransferase 1-like isoform X2 n=1 Tax=Macrosteles quadrilineatus TaxID=74068 RepID=UPI0023E27F22|nr:beta-1,4-glucuronyltransferase 1-like isoform X2 [Macrosteles quadrilineatus]